MKRVISIVLLIVLTLSVSVIVYADDGDDERVSLTDREEDYYEIPDGKDGRHGTKSNTTGPDGSNTNNNNNGGSQPFFEGNVLIFGDSRTVGMASSLTDYYVLAQVSSSAGKFNTSSGTFSWISNSNYSRVNTLTGDVTNDVNVGQAIKDKNVGLVVYLMGVNALGSPAKDKAVIEYFKAQGCKVIYGYVFPVDETKCSRSGYSAAVTNANIQTFNNTLKGTANMDLDLYSKINLDSIPTSDGLHYTNYTTISSSIKGAISDARNKTENSNNNNNNNDNNTSPSIELSGDAQKVKTILASSGYSKKADGMAIAYDMCKTIFGTTSAGIGLMGNMANEGSYGLIEYIYVPQGGGNFKKVTSPYLGTYMHNPAKTIDEIQALKNIGTTPSCGFGSVQWSFGRRVNLCDNCLKYMKSDSDVTSENYAKAECDLLKSELAIGGTYYNSIMRAVNGSTSVRVWAEAFTDYYEICAGYCGSGKRMTGVGSACQTRMNSADDIYNKLRAGGM